MGNLHRGQISAEIGGKSYTLRIATNEWIELEEEHGKSTDQLIGEFYTLVAAGTLRMSYLRSFFRAALIGENPDITHHEAGEIMSDVGLVEAGSLLGKVISASMPEPKPEDEKANPPKATTKSSTGRRSSNRG